jgi:hypothetical protein
MAGGLPPAEIDMKRIIHAGGIVVLTLALAGCAFDLSYVSQKPATFSPAHDGHSFLLLNEVKAHLGTGYPTILRANTIWRQVGSTEQGLVYSTQDQIVKVEASNIYEAYLVVSGQSLVGFYLPVENTFVPLHSPITLPIENKS